MHFACKLTDIPSSIDTKGDHEVAMTLTESQCREVRPDGEVVQFGPGRNPRLFFIACMCPREPLRPSIFPDHFSRVHITLRESRDQPGDAGNAIAYATRQRVGRSYITAAGPSPVCLSLSVALYARIARSPGSLTCSPQLKRRRKPVFCELLSVSCPVSSRCTGGSVR
jgi:hypothetical protein